MTSSSDKDFTEAPKGITATQRMAAQGLSPTSLQLCIASGRREAHTTFHDVLRDTRYRAMILSGELSLGTGMNYQTGTARNFYWAMIFYTD